VRGPARRVGSRHRSRLPGEREANREKVLALVHERPGITKAELMDVEGLSSAGVAQDLRRMLDRGEVREEALPGGATGYRIADNRAATSPSGAEGDSGS
jgi:predicted HTH transcriptional regulator